MRLLNNYIFCFLPFSCCLLFLVACNEKKSCQNKIKTQKKGDRDLYEPSPLLLHIKEDKLTT